MKQFGTILLSLLTAAAALGQPFPKPKVLVKFIVTANAFRNDLGDSAEAAQLPGNINRRAECEREVASAMTASLTASYGYLDWVSTGPAPYTLQATLADVPGTNGSDQQIVYSGIPAMAETHLMYSWDSYRDHEAGRVISKLREDMARDVRGTRKIEQALAKNVPLARSITVKTGEHRILIPVMGVGAKQSTLRVDIPDHGLMKLLEADDDQMGVVGRPDDFHYKQCDKVDWPCMLNYTKGRNDLNVYMSEYRPDR